MKITFVAFTGRRGGAAKALIRIKSMLDNIGYKTSLISVEDYREKQTNREITTHYIGWFFSHLLSKLQKQSTPTKCSLNMFGSTYVAKEIKKAKILHVHWINNETVNIKKFPLFSNKSIITLHDEWFYCGAEHHALDKKSYTRVSEGYTKNNKNVKGLDLNRLVWQQKKKYYPSIKNVIFTVPSNWMRNRAKNSILLHNKDIRVIPNPINCETFKKQSEISFINGINKGDFIITFGAINAGSSNIKGFDLLVGAINIFSRFVTCRKKIKIIIFGGRKKKVGDMFGIKTIELGHVSSEKQLAEIYSLSSVTIVPSRAESFGQVAAESLSCETPVIAFNCSGLTDIVQHKVNGYLASPFSVTSLADGIFWFYSLSSVEKSKMGLLGRKHVLNTFSKEVVRNKFISLYNEIAKNRAVKSI